MSHNSDGSREDADIATSSEDYATRFAGDVGRWFLETQTRHVLELLRSLPAPASVLDVGGGHAQIAPALIDAGYAVTVAGSDPSCAVRLAPWIQRGSCRFEVADLLALPYPARSFDVVICLRLLPHSISWHELVAELCRVARHSVVLDYPSKRSANILSGQLFALKQGIERNTRPFMLFSPRQIRAAIVKNGLKVAAERPQFLVPMALHRLANRAGLSRTLEGMGQALGLTRWFASPVVVRADRNPPA